MLRALAHLKSGDLAKDKNLLLTTILADAITLLSGDPRYGLVPGTAGFCNALDHLLPHAQLWLHGHLHCPVDYTHQGCRVVANPLGYAHKNEQITFEAQRVVSV